MRHPFEQTSPRLASRWWIVASLATVLLTVALGVVDVPLRTPPAPNGIISFELARTTETAAAIVASWDPTTRLYAAFSLGFDYLYLVSYSCALALGCIWVVARIRARYPQLATAGIAIAWAQWAAAMFDGVENFALFQVLTGSTAEHWPALAWACSSAKFGIIAVGALFLIAGATLGRAGPH